MRSVGFAFIILFALFFSGCKYKRQIPESQNHEKISKQEQLYKVNQYLVRQDATIIRSEAERRGWNLSETGTGLFYEIINSAQINAGKNTDITIGDEVILDYSVTLLDGTPCYSSVKSGPKVFRVEKSEAESGLHEAVQLLHQGDSARLILPPHLGFGIVGDGDKIPPRAILLYLIKIRSVARMGNS